MIKKIITKKITKFKDISKLKIIFGFFSIFILLGFINFNSTSHSYLMENTMSNMEMQKSLMDVSENLKHKLIDDGKYKCCLKNPCSYCLLKNIKKTEKFDGKVLVCDCLVDIMNGKHPCGECIGEILEGKGNKYIAKYFATAIAEKTGNLESIQKIIFEKYGVPIEKQV